jgi:hypothetical protein
MMATNTLFQSLVSEELLSARAANKARLNSAHEALAVIREEYAEFEAQVFLKPVMRSQSGMLHELIQIAAMCQRTAEDLGLMTGGLPSAN